MSDPITWFHWFVFFLALPTPHPNICHIFIEALLHLPQRQCSSQQKNTFIAARFLYIAAASCCLPGWDWKKPSLFGRQHFRPPAVICRLTGGISVCNFFGIDRWEEGQCQECRIYENLFMIRLYIFRMDSEAKSWDYLALFRWLFLRTQNTMFAPWLLYTIAFRRTFRKPEFPLHIYKSGTLKRDLDHCTFFLLLFEPLFADHSMTHDLITRLFLLPASLVATQRFTLALGLFGNFSC